MKIGILQAGHSPDELRPEVGNYGEMFQTLLDGNDFEFEIFSVVDQEFPASPEDMDGWIITGSKHGAYDDLPWIPPLEDLIHKIVDTGRPLIGVCFGHQIIAQALGGKVEKFKGGWAVGHQAYDFGGTKMAFNAWHQDQVTQRPEGAVVVGSNDFCENAALIYGDQILTIQPHPEFGALMIDGLIHTRGQGTVPQELLDAATENLLEPVANQTFADLMADFLRKERA